MPKVIMEKETSTLMSFIFVLFDSCENLPEAAAEKTATAIKGAFDLLYPKELNHKAIRRDWTLRFCAYLRDSLDELIEEVSYERDKTVRR